MIRWTLAALVLASAAPAAAGPPLPPWGWHGHSIAGRAAATDLPEALPAFFRDAAAQLEYLNPEPDRWRDYEQRAMDQAWSYDHYIDMENVPDSALLAPDRWRYLDRVYAAGLENPVRDTGFLPYRILEMYQRLATEWRMWREAPPRERAWIQERILNDAGILGHYVTDAAQPQHTTIHYNGWSDGVPNPEGYTTDRGSHARFESEFVRAHVTLEDLLPAMDFEVHALDDPWGAVLAHIGEANRLVPTLYRLDRDVGFSPDRPAAPEAKAFAVERLTDGAELLRDLWWSAWVQSGRPEGGR